MSFIYDSFILITEVFILENQVEAEV